MTAALESVCPLDCPDTCSLTVEVDGGRLTKVDGSHRNPYTAGFICAKVRRYPERVHSPWRLLYPQRRVGAKGEGLFERISWDEALAEIAERFAAIIARHGAEAILPYHYGGSNGLFSEGGADARFFHLLGASELNKTICAAPSGAAVRSLYGGMAGVPFEQYPRARLILLWGVNPSATSIHFEAILRRARAAGALVAVIDPRRTRVASQADFHLAPRPGTDVALALAIAGELIRQGGIDRDFIDAHVRGFDGFAEAAQAWPLERAAEVCDVPAAALAELAQRYAEATPAVIRCGWGVERNRNGANAVRAILALPAIAGKFGVYGGGYTLSLSRSFPIDAAALARPDLRPRPVRSINMSQLGRVLCEPLDPPVAALFVYNANPVAMAPDQNRVLRGLQRDDLFTVVHEQVMTDTARFADVLLPATTVFEQSELHKSYGHYFLQYSDAVIPPVGESRSNAEMFGALAARLGVGEPSLFEPERLLDVALLPGRVEGVGSEQLRQRRAVAVRGGGQRAVIQMVTDLPLTPSGKIELDAAGFGPIEYRSLPPSGYPLALLSPASARLINSTFGEFNLPEPRLEMHPGDAEARGLRQGEVVRVYNDLGCVEVVLRLSSDIRPGCCSLPKGLWRHTTRNGSTATALAPDHLSDYGEGACFNDARVEVESARPSRPTTV